MFSSVTSYSQCCLDLYSIVFGKRLRATKVVVWFQTPQSGYVPFFLSLVRLQCVLAFSVCYLLFTPLNYHQISYFFDLTHWRFIELYDQMRIQKNETCLEQQKLYYLLYVLTPITIRQILCIKERCLIL